MLRHCLLASASLLLSAGFSHAADVTDTTTADWSGFYVGIQGGYGGGTFDYPMNITNDSNLDYDFGADLTAGGFFGGFQAGWNWQMDHLLLGIEGDISLADINAEAELYSNTAKASVSGGSTVDWFATARLRAGYLATSDLLLYATGGLAWGSVNASYDIDLGSFGSLDDSTSKSQMGWTLGGGFEYAVSHNISLKTEYLYVDLGSARLLNEELGGVIANQADRGSTTLKIDQDVSFHTVKAGINYRF